MSIQSTDLHREMDLRSRAVSSLSRDGRDAKTSLTAAPALNVLHTLASSSATAGDALAVLHELQVHQVELELQQEELQRAGSELEASLVRQTQLYDHAPVALLSLDADNGLVELNLAAARLLGQERHALMGQALHNFLTPDSRSTLSAQIERVRTSGGSHVGDLTLRRDPPVPVRATVGADPASSGLLLALTLSGDGQALDACRADAGTAPFPRTHL
jgi:PAS domain S-box-containing protein